MRSYREFTLWGIIGIISILVSFFFSPVQPVEAQTNTFFVSPEGGLSYCSRGIPCLLSTAKTLWDAGDTIYFQYGEYDITTTLIVDVPLSLIGGWTGGSIGEVEVSPKDFVTLLNFSMTANPGIQINSDNAGDVRISGFSMTYLAGEGLEILGGSQDHSIYIENNVFQRFDTGIDVSSTAYDSIVITNNVFDTCRIGIDLYCSTEIPVYVLNNTFYDGATGILKNGAYQLNISNNIFSVWSDFAVYDQSSTPVGGKNLVNLVHYVGDLPSEGLVVADPGLVNPVFGNFHILESSPARNAGTTPFYSEVNILSVDFEGDGRPKGGFYDIGADEFLEPDLIFNLIPLFIN